MFYSKSFLILFSRVCLCVVRNNHISKEVIIYLFIYFREDPQTNVLFYCLLCES